MTMDEHRFVIPDELVFPVDDDFAKRLMAAMTRPLCADEHHDARRREDITNKARLPCPACGGTWVDFGRVTVHCFTCPHVEVGTSPQDAHDRMERHYAEAHAALIRRLAGGG